VRPIWLLPDELKKARERRGLSAREAAESAGVPEELLIVWEKGDEAPTLEQAHALAQIYNTSLQRFLQPVSEPPPRLDLRAQRPLEEDERERLISEAAAQFEHWCDTAANLEGLMGQRRVRLRRLNLTEPALLASSIRREYNLADSPIRNIRRLLEQDMGVLVFSLPLDGVSGMSWWHPNAGPAILVNRNDTGRRQNWTLAHELAHLLSDHAVVMCDTTYWNTSEPRERFADAFAAEFLLPREEITRYIQNEVLGPLLPDDETLNNIAGRYGVSREATSRRLEALGFLPHGFTADQLPRWLEGWRKGAGFRRRSALRRRRVKDLSESLVGQAIRGYTDGKITLSKLAESLDLGVIEAEQLVAEWQSRAGLR
jgi:Zn-dependent peptidase ImmA (M78 family)/DNA-binding XRE family transcriptional regulator